MRDYKRTLNMPVTEFEMKGNLNQKEPKIQSQWVLDKIEKLILTKNKNGKPFVLHDGPPYANGDLHLGHALNKIIKDFILRYKGMNGFYTKFIPGWDTHGLPIEQELLKRGLNKDPKLTISDKRRNCKKFAIDNVYRQKDQFRRLGILSEMEDIYITCDRDYEVRQLQIFAKMLSKGLIYQDLKPVYWSPSSQTALADAEIEYKDVESNSIYVEFSLQEKNDFVSKNDKIIIWTTTPWTLPSNLAVAVNPKISYSKVKVNDKTYIIASSLIEKVSKKLSWENYEILNEFNGKVLDKISYKHPLYEKKCKIILASYVSESDGTGLVHNAPGFGHDDYLACKKYDIKAFCPIDNYGKFTSEVKDKEIEGLFYNDANEIIIERLKKSNSLLLHEKIIHSAAHDWRTKKPIIYRATKQWFVNISKINSDIIKSLNKVKSIDPTIIKKMKEMINNRQEWCISRQRIWGVPIPIIYDKDEKPILDTKLINNIIDIINDNGINSWYIDDVKDFLPEGYSTSKKYIKETDIMDVWFDSGTSYSVLKANKLPFPADLYFEGKDQFRGWFNSSIITSVAVHNTAPYKMLLTHGFVLDEKGNKMSKSSGNGIDPMDVCKELGADVLRIWVASSDFLEDVRISKDILNQSAEIYRRIRNTLFKFILGNLNDFDIKKFRNVKYSQADLYVQTLLTNSIKEITECYENFNYKNIIKIINKNISDLSSWYFDYIKDILYCEKSNNPERIGIQATLYLILDNYLKLLAPIIPHTCEEAYSFIEKKDKEKSIHLEKWANFKLDSKLRVDLSLWNKFFEIKNYVYSELEKARNEKIILQNGDAIVNISSIEKMPFDDETMRKYLNVAGFTSVQKTKGSNSIKIKSSKFIKCDRCWNYYNKNNMSTKEKEICIRCDNAINN